MRKVSRGLKQRWVAGSIIEIDLMDGTYTYGLVLKKPLVAFFAVIRKDDEEAPSFDFILKSKILFRIAVYDYAVRNVWLRIGKVIYDSNLDTPPSVYVINPDTGEITIWREGGGMCKGTLEEIFGMESFRIWEDGAVEQRLRDHFAGRPSWYLQKILPGTKRISAKEFYAQYGYDFHWLDDD